MGWRFVRFRLGWWQRVQMKLAKPINEGWVFSKDKESVKIFASYDKDPVTKEITFGDRTMIPTSWVVKMTKLN
jgi:hypothetical protein